MNEEEKCLHIPNPATIAPVDKGRIGAEWIIDIWCEKCGQSGSMRIDPREIQWE